MLAGWCELAPFVSYLCLVRLSPACSAYLSCRRICSFAPFIKRGQSPCLPAGTGLIKVALPPSTGKSVAAFGLASAMRMRDWGHRVNSRVQSMLGTIAQGYRKQGGVEHTVPCADRRRSVFAAPLRIAQVERHETFRSPLLCRESFKMIFMGIAPMAPWSVIPQLFVPARPEWSQIARLPSPNFSRPRR